MDYYCYAIVDVLYKWYFEILNISIALSLWAVADHFRDKVKEDSGYFSHKTGPDKTDIWHHCKRASIFFFVLAGIGDIQLVYLLHNPYTVLIFLAWGLQMLIYNTGVISWITKRSK